MSFKRGLIAVVAVLVLAGAGWFAWPLLAPKPPPPPAPKSIFADWAAIVVAGDWRAHSGAPSMVFDNARRDLVRAFLKLGFQPENIRQFSVLPGKFPFDGVQLSAEQPIATGLAAVTAQAKGGCLIYFTSHGSPTGIVIGSRVVDPGPIAGLINQDCGSRRTVVIVSACFSGIFIPALAGPNRVVFTAARPDRTSFGCGEEDKYTFFNTCVLSRLDAAVSFPDLANKVDDCVAAREAEMNAEGAKKHQPPSLPSQPQFYIDPRLAYFMNWK